MCGGHRAVASVGCGCGDCRQERIEYLKELLQETQEQQRRLQAAEAGHWPVPVAKPGGCGRVRACVVVSVCSLCHFAQEDS
jgi:hypothetical protein